MSIKVKIFKIRYCASKHESISKTVLFLKEKLEFVDENGKNIPNKSRQLS